MSYGASFSPPILTTHRLSQTLAGIIDGVCTVVATRGGQRRMDGLLVILIWTRLRRMALRFAALTAKFRDNKLPATRPLRPRLPRPGCHAPRPTLPRLSRSLGWLTREVAEARVFAGQLQILLDDPEMKAFLQAAPQAARIFRPLCRLMGVRPDPALLPSPPSPCRIRPARPEPSPNTPRRAARPDRQDRAWAAAYRRSLGMPERLAKLA